MTSYYSKTNKKKPRKQNNWKEKKILCEQYGKQIEKCQKNRHGNSYSRGMKRDSFLTTQNNAIKPMTQRPGEIEQNGIIIIHYMEIKVRQSTPY